MDLLHLVQMIKQLKFGKFKIINIIINKNINILSILFEIKNENINHYSTLKYKKLFIILYFLN